MKIMKKVVIALALTLFSTSVIAAQDLSRYRDFSLGMSLAELSKQVNERPADARVIHQNPALIQNLTWWPVASYQSPTPQPVQEVLFSFYNGALYRIVVSYDTTSTQGLTTDDMIEAISAKYGAATRPVPAANPPKIVDYSSMDKAMAFWEDAQSSVTLSRSSVSNAFQLVMFSKQLNGQAEVAIAASVKQDGEDAPQREIARAKKEVADREEIRQSNLKAFRP